VQGHIFPAIQILKKEFGNTFFLKDTGSPDIGFQISFL
jgi:hypothetical protein